MKVHMIGIGGIAMGNLAFMLREQGHTVRGSDANVYPPMSDSLREWGIQYAEGFDSKNLKNPDIVIIGNAISRGNPEVEEVLNRGLEYMSMPEAIGHFFLKGKKVIVVAGTHGKTTTTFLIHHMLHQLGEKAGLFVGGIRQDNHPGVDTSNGEYFVIEGDEYDSAFFDKASKFLHYRPYYLALNALDYDHADIFPDFQSLEIMFDRLLRLVPSRGKVFYWAGSKELKRLVSEKSYLRGEAFDFGKKDSLWRYEKGGPVYLQSGAKAYPKLFGRHNLRNLEVASRIVREILPKTKEEDIVRAAESFPGVKRRQEILFQSQESVVMEDFAHHPVAVRETIQSVRDAFPGFLIISLFEPRSATSHRNVFQEDYSYAFKGSDYVFITEVFNLKKVPVKNRLDVRKLVADMEKASKCPGVYCKDSVDLLGKIQKLLPQIKGERILVLAMSNGSFGGIYPKLTEMVRNRL